MRSFLLDLGNDYFLINFLEAYFWAQKVQVNFLSAKLYSVIFIKY